MFSWITWFQGVIKNVARRAAIYIAIIAIASDLLGAVLFSHFEHVTFMTALYWSISTATTVGYGDITPVNSVGRWIAVGVMLTCIPLFGSLFTFLAAFIMEARIRGMTGIGNLSLLRDHILVLGYADESASVIKSLSTMARIVVVAEDLTPELLPTNVWMVKGDPREASVLAKARVQHAKHVVITGMRDGDMLEVVIVLREIMPHLPIAVSTSSPVAVRALKSLGVQHTLNSQEILGHLLAKTLQAPHAAELLLAMVNSDEFVIDERPVLPEYIGRPFSELRAHFDGFVLGLAQGKDVALGVKRNPIIQEGDHVLCLQLHKSHR